MKKERIITNILCAVMVAFLAFGLVHPFIANAGTKDDYAAAQEKLDRINKTISDLKTQQRQQQAKKDNAQKQIDLVKQQISILNTNIAQTGRELEQKQNELEEKKQAIRDTDALFKERLKAMYIMRSGGTVSTLLSVNSFSQLLTATDTLQRISVADTNLLKYLDEQKKNIEEEETQIQQQLDELVRQQSTMESKQKELAGLLQTINSQLSDTEAASAAASRTQREVYAEYLAAKEAMEAEFGESVSGDYVGGEYIWPVPTNGSISSGFGWRILYGQSDYHTGIDINTGNGPYIYNQPIVASNTGVVTKAVYNPTRGYGNYVIIDHGGNNFTLYGHCSSLAVKVGDVVSQGQTIAYVGSTGNSTGPHLHFEIRLNNKQIDPAPYVESTRPAVR